MRPGGCDPWAELLETEDGFVAPQAFLSCEAKLEGLFHL